MSTFVHVSIHTQRPVLYPGYLLYTLRHKYYCHVKPKLFSFVGVPWTRQANFSESLGIFKKRILEDIY